MMHHLDINSPMIRIKKKATVEQKRDEREREHNADSPSTPAAALYHPTRAFIIKGVGRACSNQIKSNDHQIT